MADKLELVLDLKDKFSGTLDKYDKKLDGVNKSSDKATKATKGFSVSADKLGAALGGLALGALAKQAFDYVDATHKNAMEMNNLALATGTSVEKFTALNYAFEKVGLSSEETEEALGRMGEAMGSVASGGENKFDLLGISVKKASGELKTQEELFYETVDGLGAIEDSAKRAGLADELFGDAGKRLAVVIKDGSGALKENTKEAIRNGNVITTKSVTAAKAYTESMTKLKAEVGQTGRELTTALTPMILETSEAVADAIKIWGFWGDSIGDFWDKIHSNGKEKVLGLALTKEQMESNAPALLKGLGKVSEKVRNMSRDWEELGGNTAENVKQWNKLKASKDRLISTLDDEGISTERAMKAASVYVGQQDKQIANAKKLADIQKSKTKDDKSKDIDDTTSTSTSTDTGKEVDFRAIIDAKKAEHDAVIDLEYDIKSKKYDAQVLYQAEKASLEQESYLMTLDGQALELANLQEEYDIKLQMYKDHKVDTSNLTEQFAAKEAGIKKKYLAEEVKNDRNATNTKLDIATTGVSIGKQLSQLAINDDKATGREKKRMAIATALIDGGLGVGKAFAQFGWPAGMVPAGIVTAQTAANVALIASQKFATGGIVQGSSYTGDKNVVGLNAGEAVLNTNQQNNLMALANGSGGSGGSSNVTINISGNIGTNEQKIAQMVRNGLDAATRTSIPNSLG